MPRIALNDMDNEELTDHCYKVYREVIDQNADVTLQPFPAGIDRYSFQNYRILIQGQHGGMYQGPTIKALIYKILRAERAVFGIDEDQTK